MEKTLSVIRSKLMEDWLAIIGCAVVTLLFFGIMVFPNFVTDSYLVSTASIYGNIATFLLSGRFFSALFAKVVMQLGLSTANQMRISYIIAAASTGATVYCAYTILRRLEIATKIKSKSTQALIRLLLATPIAISPLYIEYYSFYERGIMCLGVLFAFCGALWFDRFLVERHNKSKAAISMLLGLLSLLCYQGCFGAYLVLACFISLCRFCNAKQFIKDTATAVMCYLVPSVVEVVLVKLIIKSPRVGSAFNPLLGLETVVPHLQSVIELWGIVPKASVLVLPIFLTAIVLADAIKNRKMSQFLSFILSACYIFIVCLVAALGPTIAQGTSDIGTAPRIAYPFGIVIGLWISLAFCTCNIKLFRKLVIAIEVGFIVIEWYRFNAIGVSRLQTNALDYYKATQIQTEIDKYEDEPSNKSIKQLIFVAPHSPATPYSVNNPGNLNDSAFSREWSDYSIMNMYFQKNYKRGEATEDQSEYCLKHADAIFTADQIQFDGDKAVVCSY